jgi:hypothetical protein
MIITQSGRFPEFLETIHPSQVGDIDGDGLKEFWDGWNRPIAFIRWAPGFESLIQTRATRDDKSPLNPDPLDPTRYALIPLIFSAGFDESTNDPLAEASAPNGEFLGAGYGLNTARDGWDTLNRYSTPNGANGPVGGKTDSSLPDHPTTDNITNHDILMN